MMAMLKPVLLAGAWLLAGNQAVAPNTITGTVRSVDLRTRTVEMITGRGLVIRTYEIQVDRNVPVRIEGRVGTLENVERGQVIQVRYTTSTPDLVASSIDVVWRVGR